jgi:very-long-chain ceramide synthase
MVLNVAFHRDRRDFSEFLLHHIVTIVLVGFSYTVNFLPVGAVIMLLMDFSDIFVAIFKMAVDIHETLQTYLFLVMASTWAYFRIWYFPMYVLTYYYE